MKAIFTFTLGCILCVNLMMIPSLGIENQKDPAVLANIKKNKAFKKLILSAHPLPTSNNEKKVFPFLQSKSNSLPYFINANMIEKETEQYQMQNESSIAVNPLNPDMLIGSSVDYRDESSTWVYFSKDGGRSWKNYNLGKPFPNWRSTNDPSVAYDPDGNAYLVYGGFGNIDDTSHGENFGENGVFISISSDGGNSWNPINCHIPVILHKGIMTMDSLFEDKYYITVDNYRNSPYKGSLYIPWKRVSPKDSATQIVVTKSIDKGRTWNIPLAVSPRKSGSSQDTTYGQSFPLIATGPEGEVYLVWNDGSVHGVGFSRSFDGAESFSQPSIIQNYNIFGKTTDLADQQDDEPVWRHTLKGIVRAEAYPVITVDTSQSERKGTLYLTWAGDNPPNIYFSSSTDKGDTWSKPVIVHSDTANDQFWQWMAVDPMNGDLAVMYLDSRDDSSNMMVECYVSYSQDGGKTWIDKRVSDFNSDIRRNPFSGHFAGDYSGMAFFRGKIYPSWVDMRNAITNIFDSDVFTSIINAWAPSPVENFKAHTIADKPDRILLTWDAPSAYSFGQTIQNEDFYYLLKSESGNFTLTSDINSYTDSNLTEHKLYKYSIWVISGGADTSYVRMDSAYAGGAKGLAAVVINSIQGNENNEINMNITLPAFRADNQTELINLAKIAFYDHKDVLLYETVLLHNEAGQSKNITFNPGQRGYFELYVKAYDDNQPANESIESNSAEIYTGIIDNLYEDSFDQNFSRYKTLGNWDIAANFSRSSPGSLTDSPEGNYPKSKDSWIYLFPIKRNTNELLNIEFWHAALIHKKDTGKVELSTDMGNTWKPIAGYNQSDYSYWTDGVLNQQDWKFEKLSIKNSIEDTAIIRFNLVSKPFNNEDGWYIDDLKMYNEPVSVEEYSETKSIILYPNPAKDLISLYIDNLLPSDIKDIRISSVLGSEVILTTAVINGNTFELDISSLSQGVYYLSLYTKNRVFKLKFVKILFY